MCKYREMLKWVEEQMLSLEVEWWTGLFQQAPYTAIVVGSAVRCGLDIPYWPEAEGVGFAKWNPNDAGKEGLEWDAVLGERLALGRAKLNWVKVNYDALLKVRTSQTAADRSAQLADLWGVAPTKADMAAPDFGLAPTDSDSAIYTNRVYAVGTEWPHDNEPVWVWVAPKNRLGRWEAATYEIDDWGHCWRCSGVSLTAWGHVTHWARAKEKPTTTPGVVE